MALPRRPHARIACLGSILLAGFGLATAGQAADKAPARFAPASSQTGQPALVALFRDWRAFVAPPLFNMFAPRSEGLATAMEEIVMQAGLYDDIPHGREIVWIMLANRAARGLAALRVQANEMDLAQAGRFHAEWTPRHWSDPASPLVGFEQLLYLRQPGSGPSYVIGKLQFDHLLALESHRAEQANQPFLLRDAFARIMASGIVPPLLIETELNDQRPAY